MPDVIEIDFDMGAAGTALDRLAAAAEDMTPAMEEIAQYLETSTKERFDTGTAPDGSAWDPSQRVIEEGGKTLVKTADLVTSIVGDFGRDFAAVGPERSGGAAEYAAIHQFGGRITPRAAGALRTPFGPRGAVEMPARPYLGLSGADREIIAEIATQHFRSAI